MKEAAGEANLTVITIILIAIVVAVATPLINNLMTNASRRACCTDAGGVWSGGDCTPGSGMYNAQGYKDCVDNSSKAANSGGGTGVGTGA